MVAEAVPPPGWVTVSGAAPSEDSSTAASTQPGTPDGGRCRRTDHIDLFDGEIRGDPVDRLGDPRGAGDSDHTRPVGADAGGDRWPLGAPTHRILSGVHHPHRPPVLDGQASGDRFDLGVPLGPERSTVGQRPARLAVGRGPGGVGFESAGFDPGGLQGADPLAVGHGDRPDIGHRGSPALHLAAGSPSGHEILGHHPPAVDARDGDERVGRCGVVGEPAAAAGHRRSDRLGRPTLQLGPAGRGRSGRRPTRARETRPRRRGSRPIRYSGRDGRPSARSTATGRPALFRRERGDPHDDARRAEPALGRTVGGERITPAIRPRGVRRGW